MYNGQPPFRPPGMPPFPPAYGGAGAPSAYPPFAPNAGFVPPPFPPNFGPGMTPPNGFGDASPGMGFRPPPGGMPPRPGHPGLGMSPSYAGLPPAPHMGSAPPGFVKDVKTTKVFVGTIAPGVTDEMLTNLLNACGPLHELKRVVGALGKPAAFGFAAFENPEVVMRCIRCLNGVELPDLTPEGRGKKKALTVKADEKTKTFLDEFESTLGRSDDDETADAQCRKAIAHQVALLTDPNAEAPDGLPNRSGGRSPIEVVVPAHLQDLKEGDLPENQRVVVLDQIAIFRENAARRERDKKKLDDEKDRMKAMEAAANPRANQPSTAGYGYGQRAFGAQHLQQQREQERPSRQWGQPQTSPSQSTHQQNGSGTRDRRNSNDPQGYDKPVNFVKAQQAEGKNESERTDEEEEEFRRRRRNQERDYQLREREKRVEHRERQRIDRVQADFSQRRQQADAEERSRRRQKEMYDDWDDDEKIERGRDWFYSDRSRWRAQRQQARMREFQADLRDIHLEEDERKAIELESEEFLKRQMEELAELEEEQKKRGLLTEDAAPIRLAMQATTMPEPKKEEKKVAPPPPAKVPFGDDEDDENEERRRKRGTFIRLEDEGQVRDGMTEAEKIAQRNARLLDIKRQVPTDRRRLWNARIEWSAITNTLVQDKLRPFVHDKMVELLGEADDDLSKFVLDGILDRKSPEKLTDGLEPVFAEEAATFVTTLWRQLVFESTAYNAHIETGTVMV